MAKLIKSIQHSFTGKNGETVKGLVFGDPKSKFPFEMYAQKCLRLSLFLGRYGDKAARVLEAFIGGKQVTPSDTLGYTEYKGHDLIVLRGEAEDKIPLQFGSGKAKLILAVIKEHGIPALLATLQDAIGDAQLSTSKAPSRGKGKGKPQGGKGGGGKPRVEVEVEDLDDMAEEVEVMAHQVGGNPELSLDQQIAKAEALVKQLFEAIPQAQATLRQLYAAKQVMVA